MRRFGKRASVISTALSVLLVAGVAFAAWTANGTGSGSAAAGEAKSVQVEGGTVTAALYPTGKGTVTVKVTNPNPYAVTVTKIDTDGAPTTAAEGCTDSTVSWVKADGYTFTQRIASGGSHTFTLTDAVEMSNDAEGECQNAQFQVPVSVTAASSS